MDKRLIRKIKGCLDKAEAQHIDALDIGDETVLHGLNPKVAVPRLIAAVKAACDSNRAAHQLYLGILSGNGDDDELAFTPARRKSRLDALDRAPVGRSASPRTASIPSQPRGIGGAFLAAQMREDAQRRLNAYWGMQ